MAAKLVIVGLLVATAASAITGPPSGSLPGVALDSVPLLLVERTLAFFAAWLAIVVVVAQALKGHLPERRHELEIEALRRALVELDQRGVENRKG